MAVQDKAITRLSIRGKEYPVQLRVYTWGDKRPPSSTFVLEGLTTGRYKQEVTADTLEDLYKKGMAASKANAVKIEFPIMRLKRVGRYREPEQYEWETGVVTGRHQGNGNVLVRWGDSKTIDQEANHYNSHGDFFSPLSAEDQREFIRLRLEQDKVEAQIDAIKERYVIADLIRTVDEEIERKASEVSDGE